jgi:hypothetical protein
VQPSSQNCSLHAVSPPDLHGTAGLGKLPASTRFLPSTLLMRKIGKDELKNLLSNRCSG